MGEIADMMLEGAMCQWCGEYLGDGDGFPVVCAGCQREHGVNMFGDSDDTQVSKLIRKYPCPVDGCKRKLKTEHGVQQHVRMAHEGKV